jgi:hypothetical protein
MNGKFNGQPTFAKRVFLIAAVYGLLVLAPQYLLEPRVGRDYPPAITHPEFYYGFIGVGLAWQLLFLVISHDPRRYRLAMLPAVVEKFSFGLAVLALYFDDRVAGVVLAPAAIDLVLGILFLEAYRRTTLPPA